MLLSNTVYTNKKLEQIFDECLYLHIDDMESKKKNIILELQYLYKVNDSFCSRFDNLFKQYFGNTKFRTEKQFLDAYLLLIKNNSPCNEHFVFPVTYFIEKILNDNNNIMNKRFYKFFTHNINKHLNCLKEYENFDKANISQIINSKYSLQPE